jgi:uncharacterized cupin superfamily protein
MLCMKALIHGVFQGRLGGGKVGDSGGDRLLHARFDRAERKPTMAQARRHPHVVNVEEIEPWETSQGNFVSRRRRMGSEGGCRAVGCTYIEVPPGKTAFPLHWHSSQEEALYILEGTGKLRVGKETVEVGAGDFVGHPTGPQHAHALTNTGTTPLRYLALSAPAAPITMDVVGYPDSKKLAFASGVDPAKGFRGGGSWVMKIIKEDTPMVDYYDDEPLAK